MQRDPFSFPSSDWQFSCVTGDGVRREENFYREYRLFGWSGNKVGTLERHTTNTTMILGLKFNFTVSTRGRKEVKVMFTQSSCLF